MADIVAEFGRYIDSLAPEHPERSRRLLLAAYQVFGQKLRFLPDKRLPKARQEVAYTVNRAVVHMLAHPERAALVSLFMPCELLDALNILPMCAELYASFIAGTDAEEIFAQSAEEKGIPETFCSYHKVLLGSAYTKVLPAPSLIVNTSLVCDANNLTFRELADWYGIPQFYVDVPPRGDEESVRYVADQFRELAAFLQEATGRKLEEEKLKAVVARSRDTVALLRAAAREKRGHALPGDITSELYEIYMTHNALGSASAHHYAAQMLEDIRSAPPAHGVRLLWLHTIPHWQAPVKELLDYSDRVQVIGCDINLEGLVDMDPEQPYESMARRLVHSRWNSGEERVRLAVEAAEMLGVDGVVCFCHWGCKQTMGLSGELKQALEAAGFPMLILNGDGCDRRNASDGQVATRLNAFLEMLEARHG